MIKTFNDLFPKYLPPERDIVVAINHILINPFLEGNNVHFTTDRFLPKILVDVGAAKSTSDVKRQRPDLWVTIPDELNCIPICYGNPKKIWSSYYIYLICGLSCKETRDSVWWSCQEEGESIDLDSLNENWRTL